MDKKQEPADEASKTSEGPAPAPPPRVHGYDPDAKEEPGHGPDDIAVSREDRELVPLQHFG